MVINKDIKEMRHEVIELSILLENYLDEEITTFFGLDSWDASYHIQIDRERNIFVENFLRYMPINKKFKIIKKLIKEIGEDLYEGFWKDEERFREIRNKFAHTIYPEVEEDFMPKMKVDLVKLQQKDWEKMYDEAKILYLKLLRELDSKFYTPEPRRRKHKTFHQNYLLEVINKYENIINDSQDKKGIGRRTKIKNKQE